ncbi:restriction endonuclease, partial [Acinetobacter baumannii]
VSVDIIRSVVGVHHMRNANKSVIVTTGFFTKDALDEAKLVKNSLDLKDYYDLKDMLSRY